jgi:hypothetical protein
MIMTPTVIAVIFVLMECMIRPFLRLFSPFSLENQALCRETTHDAVRRMGLSGTSSDPHTVIVTHSKE